MSELLDHMLRTPVAEETVRKEAKFTAEEKEILVDHESGKHTSLPAAQELIERFARYAKKYA
jgi:hypothetical protein